MNVVDIVIIGALAVFAWSGWRQGFIAGLLSFIGFLGGGLLAAVFLPGLIARAFGTGFGQSLLIVGLVLACAVVGQALVGGVGRRLRNRITWEPARVVDHAGGAALNVVSLLVVLWVIASSIALLPDMAITRQVRGSALLVTIDRAVPDAARNAFTGLRDAIDASDFPRVFAGLGEVAGPEVAAPDDRLLDRPAVRRTWPSLVRISGAAPDCRSEVAGSGFVYARERVMTNAHVVAGVERPYVAVPGGGAPVPAEVVYFDPDIDLAVLAVPGLTAAPLAFEQSLADTGDPAVVAGYPGGGPLDSSAARIRAVIDARGEDIYGRAGVVREVYAFRGTVVAGNSGGPLLAPDGEVLGVVFASAVGDSSTGYALTAPQVSAAAAVGRSATSPVDTGSCRTR
jgi:S1-C subfamily serine protease